MVACSAGGALMNYDDKSALEYAQDTLKQLQEIFGPISSSFLSSTIRSYSELEWVTIKVRIDLSVHALKDLEDYIREVLPRRN
jgi:hypothetical protein